MQVLYTPSAERDLARLSAADANVTLAKLDTFVDRWIGDAKKLTNYNPPTWTLRAENFLIFFRYERSAIVVIHIVDRTHAYRRVRISTL
jgi:mRNA-degrading endonuclease RelE of RelBE toxin-antitoxin system